MHVICFPNNRNILDQLGFSHIENKLFFDDVLKYTPRHDKYTLISYIMFFFSLKILIIKHTYSFSGYILKKKIPPTSLLIKINKWKKILNLRNYKKIKTKYIAIKNLRIKFVIINKQYDISKFFTTSENRFPPKIKGKHFSVDQIKFIFD